MKMQIGIATLLALLSSTGCADEFMIARTQRNVARIKSYRGTLSETGIVASGELRSEIFFKAPNQFLTRIITPDSFAGVTMLYEGPTLTIYYPKINYAIRFEHLAVPTAEELRELIAIAYRHNVKTFDYGLGDESHVAGLPTVALDYTAKHKGASHTAGKLQVYDRFSFPLAGQLSFAHGVEYSFHFDDIHFNSEIDDRSFELAIPKNAIVTRWDMASPDISETEMHQQANFEFALPALKGFTRERAIRVDGPVPAFTVAYRRGPQFLLVSMFKDSGLRVTSEDLGIPLTIGGVAGRLLVSPTVSSYTFKKNGTMYIVTSNVPFDELLTVVAAGEPAAPQQVLSRRDTVLDPY